MALARPLLAAVVGLALAAPAAWPAAFTVSSPADDGAGSLRAALVAAAETDGPDAITVAVPEIRLLSPLPPLGGGLVLDGAGAAVVPSGPSAGGGLELAGPDVTVHGLRIAGFPAGVVLSGAIDGSALLGLELAGNGVGVRDDGHAGSVRIGGPADDGLRISGGDTGVLLRDAARVRFARVDGLGGLAIDRGGDGTTPNAPRAEANHPVLESAVTALGATRLTGRLDAAPGAATIDVYAARDCAPPARGSRLEHLAAVDVVAGASGVARFAVTLPGLPEGSALAATATTTTTSEISPCLPAGSVPALPAPAELVADAQRPLTALRLSRRVVRPGRPTEVTVTLAREAVVELWIARRRAGRVVAEHCRPRALAPVAAPRCTRAVSAGAIVRRLPAGATTLRLTGRLDGRTLAGGRYRLAARVVDAETGATLDERRARFRIVG